MAFDAIMVAVAARELWTGMTPVSYTHLDVYKRQDEIACRSLGLSPRRIKLTAFTISAAFAGFAGTLFAARQRCV